MLNSKILHILFLAIILSVKFCENCYKELRHENSRNRSKLRNEIENVTETTITVNKGLCPFQFILKSIFDEMDDLESNYYQVLYDYQKAFDEQNFDHQTVETMLSKKGIPERFHTKYNGNKILIPNGLNLEANSILLLPDSMLFFHKLKLRDDTRFQIERVYNNVFGMTLHVDLLLGNLHISGFYDRTIIDKNKRSELFYHPNLGELNLVFKNAKYSGDGRYRLINDRFQLVMMVSDVTFDSATLTYVNNTEEPYEIPKRNFENIIERIEIDFDNWLLKYFNDYLGDFILTGKNSLSDLQFFDGQRILTLNKKVDLLIKDIRRMMLESNSLSIPVPTFKFLSVTGTELKLSHGIMTGFSSIHRNSVALSSNDNDTARFIDVIISFANLKVMYKYSAVTNTGIPPLHGVLVFSADDMKANLRISLLNEPEAWDFSFNCIREIYPSSLTLEGPLAKEAGNFRHIIDHHILAVIVNLVEQYLKTIRIPKTCSPDKKIPYNKQEEDGNI